MGRIEGKKTVGGAILRFEFSSFCTLSSDHRLGTGGPLAQQKNQTLIALATNAFWTLPREASGLL